MSAILGRTRAYGLGKETTPGTAVSPVVWLPQQDVTVEDNINRIYDNSGLGTRSENFAGDTNLITADGNLNGIVYDNSFGHLALAAIGSVSDAGHPSATGAYDHTFTPGNTLPTYTIGIKDANESTRSAYGTLDKLELKMGQGSYVSFTSTWKAQQSTSVANTVAYVTENRYRPQDVVVKIASTVAGLSGATALRVKDLTFSIANSVITEPSLGTTSPTYYPGTRKLTLQMGRLYLDTTIKALVFGSTQQAMSITLSRPDIAIGTGTPTNPSITLTFQPGFFADWNRDGGLDALKQEKFTYEPLFSTSTSQEFNLVMTNTTASY
jgi:hypothetical protein